MRRLVMNGRAQTLLLIVSLAFNLGLCLAMAVHGAEQQRGGWPDAGRHRERLSRTLNLSPDQSEALSESRKQLFEELHTLKRQLRRQSDALAGLLTAPEVDMETIAEQAERVAEIRNQIQWRMVNHLLGMRDVLEPQQLESLREFAGRVLARSERGGRYGGKPHRHDESDRPPPEEP